MLSDTYLVVFTQKVSQHEFVPEEPLISLGEAGFSEHHNVIGTHQHVACTQVCSHWIESSYLLPKGGVCNEILLDPPLCGIGEVSIVGEVE